MDPIQGNYLDKSANNVELNPNVCAKTISNEMDTLPSTSSAIEPYAYVGMANETVPPFIEGNCIPQVIPPPKFVPRTPIVLSNSVLTPPSHRELVTRSTKPDGCQTVYVRCLPEKVTQDIIKEAFETCGNISTIKMRGKNFCFITFADLESVEQALLLSGYHIKIENKDDPAYTGILQVDYAMAYDDQHDLECRKRPLEHEKSRHEILPFPIPNYSEHEVVSVKEKLHNPETFKEGVRILNAWLERGECTKRRAGTFYSMIEIVHEHARLMQDAFKCQEEYKKARKKLDIINQEAKPVMCGIKEIWEAAKMQINLDDFPGDTKIQMENLIKEGMSVTAEFFAVPKEIDSDVVKNNAEECKKRDQTDRDEQYQLKEYNNTLKQQVASAQKELNNYKQSYKKHREETVGLKSVFGESQKVGSSENCEVAAAAAEDGSSSDNVKQNVSLSTQCVPDYDSTENEMVLLTQMSIFLHSRPLGADINCIYSHLLKTHPTITKRRVEDLLRKFPRLFVEVSSGIGATLEKKWKFIGFLSSIFPLGR